MRDKHKRETKALGETHYWGKPPTATLPKDRKEEPVKNLAYALANWSHVKTGSASFVDIAADTAKAAAKAVARMNSSRKR